MHPTLDSWAHAFSFSKSDDQLSFHKPDPEAQAKQRDPRAFQSLDPLDFEEKTDLRCRLTQRHIQSISLCATIGTGLFFRSGRALAQGGPLGAFLGYAFVAIIASCVGLSIAELSALMPLSGGVIRPAEYLVDPALSFAEGWNLVYSKSITVPADLAAISAIIGFWKEINNALWITLFGAVLLACNFCIIVVHGEISFCFAQLKITLIIGLILMGLCLAGGAGPTNNLEPAKYWQAPAGPFVQFLGVSGSTGRFLSFWSSVINAVFSYSSVETVAVAAAEVKSPRQMIPRAEKRILWKVSSLYIVSMLIIGLLVPSNDPALLGGQRTAAASPFTIAATRAGVKVVPHIINGVVLTSAWSAGNTAMFVASRTLYGLSLEGHAPRVFQRTNRYGTPYFSVSFVSLFICLAYLTLSHGAAIVFTWLSGLVATSDMVHWIVICGVYLRFFYGCKKRRIDRDTLPWKAPLQPYLAWFGLGTMCLVLLTNGFHVFLKGQWNSQEFVTSYFSIALIVVLYFGYKITRGTKIVSLNKLPIQHFLDIANANPEATVKPAKGWRKLEPLWS